MTENKRSKRYLITSALPYANGPLHVGHLAGAYIPADIYARYLRLTGEDVLYICGSDEHGAAITMRAKQEDTTPQAIVDKYHETNKADFDKIGMSFDIYHRTSSDLHRETSSAFFKALYDKGVFTEQVSEQYYDAEYDQFLADRYIKGTCPKCGNEEAYGDQCERCGSALSPTDLINPVSTLSGNKPELKTTKHWFLPMDRYQEQVKNWIEAAQGTEKWKKHVLGQCRSWFQDGLQPRSMTRDLNWGVPVPLEGAEGKVLYVWLDAPIGYISATKALTDDWASYWQSEDTKLVHFIGKDNIVFHCIIFPMLLQLRGEGYVLPTNVPANQFMNLEGDKMSTSRNHVVGVSSFLEDFPGQEDVLRYVLSMNMPENKDSDFSWSDLQARNNNELVAILGNFVNRVLVLTNKYFGGEIPEIPAAVETALEAQTAAIYDSLKAFPKTLDTLVHKYEFRNALSELMNVARMGNKFLTDTEPWKLFKTDADTTAGILRTCLDIIAVIAVYAEPFLPFTAPKLRGYLNLNEAEVKAIIEGAFRTAAGRKIEKGAHLFGRIDDAAIQLQQDKLAAAKAANEAKAEGPSYEPVKDTIQYDDFMKMDIRTGTITTAEKMKKAKKLLQLTVDLGFEQRTVVSGIAEHYTPEEVIGQKVLLLANLAPRKLRGVESQGMILMAESGGKLHFVSPGDAENGSGVS